MASADWHTMVSTNMGYSLVDTLGLVGMDQNYCWNVRSTGANAVFATRNWKDVLCDPASVAEYPDTPASWTPKMNEDGHTNFKLRCLWLKKSDVAVPFLFLRLQSATDASAQCYKLAHRADNHFALYKESLNGSLSSTNVIMSSANPYASGTTYRIEFLAYSQPNHDTFIECWLGDASDPYATSTAIFKTMIFGTDSPLLSGWCGFGAYSSVSNAYSYFDLFEVYEEQPVTP